MVKYYRIHHRFDLNKTCMFCMYVPQKYKAIESLKDESNKRL